MEDTENDKDAPETDTSKKHDNRSPKTDYFGSGSDGYMYDYVKRAPQITILVLGLMAICMTLSKDLPKIIITVMAPMAIYMSMLKGLL